MLKSCRGVGLIEIIIAILIFGIGISAAMRTLPDANKATSRARNLTVASNLAQEEIEILSSSLYSSADLTAGTHNDPRNPLQRHFTRSWTVTDNSPIANMKRIAVSVTYTTRNKDNVVTLTTFLTSRR